MGWPMTSISAETYDDPSPSDEKPRSGQERRTPWFPQIVRVCGSCRCGWSCWKLRKEHGILMGCFMGQNCQLWMYNYQLLYIQIIRHTLKLRPWSYKRGQWGEILHFEQGHSPLTSSFRDDWTWFPRFRHQSSSWSRVMWRRMDVWCKKKPCKPNAIAIPILPILPLLHRW